MHTPFSAEESTGPARPLNRMAILSSVAVIILAIDLIAVLLLTTFGPLPLPSAVALHAISIVIAAAVLFYFFILSPWYHAVSDLRMAEEEVQLAYAVLESSSEGIVITDTGSKIEYVNPAFCRITGYDREDVIGKDPGMMRSGRHDSEFYDDMGSSLAETGHWQGEIWEKKKNGDEYPKWLSMSAVRDRNNNVLKYIGIFLDISSLKQAEEHIEFLSNYDNLTGLPNRTLFRDRLRQAISHAVHKERMLAVMVIDIDDFSKLNDTFGSFAGDGMLRDFTERIMDNFGSEIVLARLGGDDFAVVTEVPEGMESALSMAGRIRDIATRPFSVKSHEVYITVSIGIALFPSDGDAAESLMRNADLAMQKARDLGNGIQLYEHELGEKAFTHLSLETNLRLALEHDEFVLLYQPLVDIGTGSIIGMEALIRRQQKEWLVPPAKFIHIAEKTGLIIQICEWTLLTACRQASRWKAEGLPPLRLSVNVTAGQFYQKTLINTVKKVLGETGVEPNMLELELTEKILMRDALTAIRMMNELKDMGVHLSIDDFGTGYSSLSYLKQFPVDKLKIDLSFVKDLPHDRNSASISKAIINLAHSLDLKVIAEGIENRRQLAFMSENGCDEMQGYYFSVPLPVDAFKDVVLSNRQLER